MTRGSFLVEGGLPGSKTHNEFTDFFQTFLELESDNDTPEVNRWRMLRSKEVLDLIWKRVIHRLGLDHSVVVDIVPTSDPADLQIKNSSNEYPFESYLSTGHIDSYAVDFSREHLLPKTNEGRLHNALKRRPSRTFYGASDGWIEFPGNLLRVPILSLSLIHISEPTRPY